jgi:hypothetical protein
MSIHPKDVLLYAGGECLQTFGTLVWRTTRTQSGALTFTRTGTAPFVDSDGTLRFASENRARISWPLVNGVRVPAYLGERASQNEFLHSEALDNAAWTKSNASITTDQAVGPDGETSLDEIIEDSTSNSHFVRQDATLTADVTYAISGFFRANTRSDVILRIQSDGIVVQTTFDLSDGSVGATTATGTHVASHIEDHGGGLYRCIVIGAIAGTTTVTGIAFLSDGGAGEDYQGDDSSSIYGGYLQLEEASFASSYTSTTTAAVTRNVDTLYADFSHAPEAMTLYFKFVEQGSVFGTGGLFNLGANAIGTGAYLSAHATGTERYNVRHRNGTAEVLATLSSGPSLGDVVEIRVALNADGSLTVGQVINDGAETTAGPTAANALPDAWSAGRLYLNSAAVGDSFQGMNLVLAVAVVRGVQTMADMQAVYA